MKKFDELAEDDFAASFAGQPSPPDPADDLARVRRHRTRRRVSVAVTGTALALAAATALAGAGSQTWSAPDPADQPTAAVASPALATYDATRERFSRMEAVKGTFQSRAGCVYLTTGPDDTSALVLFPRGQYSWSSGRIVGPRLSTQPGVSSLIGADRGTRAHYDTVPGLSLPATCRRTDTFYLVTGGTPTNRYNPSPSAPATEVGSCAGTVRLVGGQGLPVTLSPSTEAETRVRVGDSVRISASGRCRDAVHLTYQPASLYTPIDDQTVLATAAGSSMLTAGHAMCAQFDPPSAGCRGGFALDGRVRVIVEAR